MNEFKYKIVIDEGIRERVHQLFKNEQALRYSSENLNILAEAQRQAAWQEVYKRYPMLSDYKANINFTTWVCTYELEEYTHEGENVIEEIDEVDFDQSPSPTGGGNGYIDNDIHPIFDEVHTPPPLEENTLRAECREILELYGANRAIEFVGSRTGMSGMAARQYVKTVQLQTGIGIGEGN